MSTRSRLLWLILGVVIGCLLIALPAKAEQHFIVHEVCTAHDATVRMCVTRTETGGSDRCTVFYFVTEPEGIRETIGGKLPCSEVRKV